MDEKQEAVTETPQERAAREVAEFQAAYPEVTLTRQQLQELAPRTLEGVSLLQAYRDWETGEKDRQIAGLQAQLAAALQNQSNRAASPGSQADSGAGHKAGPLDDFLAGFGA